MGFWAIMADKRVRKSSNKVGDIEQTKEHDKQVEPAVTLINPGQSSGMTGFQAEPEESIKIPDRQSSGLDIAALLEKMQENNAQLVRNLVADFGSKLESKVKGWVGTVPTATVSKAPSEHEDAVASGDDLSEGELYSNPDKDIHNNSLSGLSEAEGWFKNDGRS